MTRATVSILLLAASLALPSCGSDQMPNRPLVGSPGAPPTSTPTDSILDANRAIWTASGIASYRYRFNWQCYCGTDHVRLVDITVSRGIVVSVVDATTRQPLDAQATAQFTTVDGLFDFVRKAIDAPAASIQSAFDLRYGYPISTFVDYAPNIADDENGFRIYSLTQLRN